MSEWSDDPLHSLLAYMKFHQILTPAQWTSLRHACDIGRSELDALRQLVGREALQKFRSEHLRACLLEIFGWENGTYVCQKVSFCEENIVDQSLDCGISLLQAGIFTKISMYRILQRLEFIVPYFLKLTVDKKNVLNFDVTAQTDAVLDYLERGGTLVEMLVHLPSDCPVHRLVYLLLVLGYLDLT